MLVQFRHTRPYVGANNRLAAGLRFKNHLPVRLGAVDGRQCENVTRMIQRDLGLFVHKENQ